MKKWLKIGLAILSVLGVMALAWIIRWHALTTLNIDYDEDDYLRAGQEYAHLIREKDWAGFLETNYRPEHPPLAKIMVGISILNQPEPVQLVPDRPSTASPNNYLPRNQVKNGRIANAIFGTLAAGLLAIVDPVAGALLAIHAFTVKYVSQIMLEALPAFLSLCSVLCYLQAKKKKPVNLTWLVFSAIFLGLTGASKYLYCVAGIAILVDWVFQSYRDNNVKKEILNILLWGFISIMVFFAADPYLWPNPLTRLKESVLFHSLYSTSAEEVQNAGFPVWQPFFWLFSTPKMWQSEAIWVALDPLITILAFFGIRKQWQKRPVMIIWLLVAIVFLLIWPTKWPQYIVILTAPLCLTASEGINQLFVDPLRNFITKPKKVRVTSDENMRSGLKKTAPWLIPGLIIFLIFTILPLLYQLGVSITDFSSTSIKDGFNGGIWREIWGGLTGVVDPISANLQSHSKEVHYIGFGVFGPAFEYILSSGTLFNNLFWMVTSVLLQTFLGIGIGLLLWQKGVLFKKGWQALFILPWAIPEMIGALMWFNVFAPTTGWLSLGIAQFGEKFPFAFLSNWSTSTNLWLVVLLISGVWYGFPFMMLATSAGLKMLPAEVLEAAQLDGANNLKTLRFVLWPLLLPLILPAMIIRAIFAFNQFYLFQAFYSTGTTLASLSYNLFYNGQYSFSAVINILNILILVALVIILNRTNKLGEGVSYA
jgi:ABC-type sugar transport system permease subunit